MTKDELTEWLSTCRTIRPVVGGNYDRIADELISSGLVTVTAPWKPQAGKMALLGERRIWVIGQWHDGQWLVQFCNSDESIFGPLCLARPDQLSPIGEQMDDVILAWHFCGDTLRDGRPIPPDGEWLVHDGEVIPCQSGLHASERIIDALKYAPGSTICRVEVRGDIKYHDNNKLAGRERRILWRVDGEQLLHKFARQCALDVIHLWKAPDVVSQYLETGDEALRKDARKAAGAAQEAAAEAAAWAAQEAAAEAAAAGAAAWAAAGAAQEAAAGAAAWAATSWGAARAAQNERLTKMVEEARSKED
jgi:hypothetical protein